MKRLFLLSAAICASALFAASKEKKYLFMLNITSESFKVRIRAGKKLNKTILPTNKSLIKQEEFFSLRPKSHVKFLYNEATDGKLRIRIWPHDAQLTPDINAEGRAIETSENNKASQLCAFYTFMRKPQKGLVLSSQAFNLDLRVREFEDSVEQIIETEERSLFFTKSCADLDDTSTLLSLIGT